MSGRGVELTSITNDLLNDLLRDLAYEHKWPELRKVGATETLAGITHPLPSDFGNGMDNLLFGDEKVPLKEYDADDFVFQRGFPEASQGNSRPDRYMVDLDANVFRFNHTPDKTYSFVPIYYKTPAAITNDNDNPWFTNDRVLIQLLMAEIMTYTDDERQFTQEQKARGLLAEFKRGVTARTGGSKTVSLARGTFRQRFRKRSTGFLR